MRDRIGVSAQVTSPATSANVGPGFDSFGLCLAVRDTVTAMITGRGLRVEITGEGADSLPRDESHLVVRSMRATFTALEVAQPGLSLHCANVIPHGRGLGSSAAAIVSGIRLAERLAERELEAGHALDLASRLEGHPDNAAACLFGGFTVAWTEGHRPHVLRLDVNEEIRCSIFVPTTTLSTTTARRLLPGEVKHRDATANSARAGLLVAALTQRPDLLLPATEDRLHQDQRRSAMPQTLALLDAMREAGVAAVVSGAGPSILAFGTAAEPVDSTRWKRPGWRSFTVAIDPDGAMTARESPSR